jgi:ribose transport system ATP-binding protein
LLTNPKLIVFDESTAVLAKKECDILFGIIRELGRRISIVYISHYLKEILDLCDRVTVLRNGENVDTFRTKGKTVEDLVLSMVGRGVGSLFPARNSSLGEPLISVKNFSRDNFFKNVNFEIRRGEILGLTGLMGSGHVCVGQSLYYGGKGIRGDVLLNGVRVGDTDPERSVGRGFAFVPEDRHRLGVLQQISVKENITLSNLHNICNKGIIDAGKERGISLDLISKLNIKTPSEEQTAGLLSGGNQQKVVIARWLCNGSSFFILNQPTSGVDVGARLEIYNHIRDLASEGAAILLISQDIQELVGLSDRVIIMYRGEIADELDTGEDISDRVIVSMAGGGQNVA